MKAVYNRSVLVFIGLVAVVLILSASNTKKTRVIDRQQGTIDSLTKVVLIQSVHFQTCSFLRRDDVATGYDGYIYSRNYRRTHGREQGQVNH